MNTSLAITLSQENHSRNYKHFHLHFDGMILLQNRSKIRHEYCQNELVFQNRLSSKFTYYPFHNNIISSKKRGDEQILKMQNVTEFST